MNDEIEEIWDDDDPEEGHEEMSDAPVERLRFITDRGQEPLRIDKFIMGKLEGATRNKVQNALEGVFITVNGTSVKSNYKIKPGDEVVVYETRKPESTEVVAEEMPLNIMYEDDELLIINKPAGMVVHPGCGNYSGTLVNGLAYYLKAEEIDTEELPRVGLVHRIDKNTSGLLLIAKTPNAMTDLAAQFKKHT